MRFILKIGVFSLVVASLALVGPQVECRGLSSLMGKLSKEWQWIDSFLKEGASSDRINKYFAENQAEMKPKMRDAMKLVVDAVNARPHETGCSESESLKVALLFEALNLDMSAEQDQNASGVYKLAFECRQEYGVFCAHEYAERLSKVLDKSMDRELRKVVERFSVSYDVDHKMKPKDLFSPSARRTVSAAGFVTCSLMGKAVYWGFKRVLSDKEKKLNKETGVMENQWVDLVREMKEGCKTYAASIGGALGQPEKDAVVSRSLERLDNNNQIWRSWMVTIACEHLQKFGDDKLAEKVAYTATHP